MFRYFFTIVMAIYIPALIYTGYRIYLMIKHFFPSVNRILYWFLFLFFSLTFVVSRIEPRVLPDTLNEAVKIFSYYWVIAMLYLFMLFFLIDIIRLVCKLTGIFPGLNKLTPHISLSAVIFVVILFLYGTWNAWNPRIINYELTINKSPGAFKQLRVAMVSDLHLSKVVDNTRLQKMVDMINAMDPDLILMPGDIIEDAEVFAEQNMLATFGKLKSKFGTYVSLGNHEYYGGMTKDSVDMLQQVGIVLLKDEYVKIADSFYVSGREDPAVSRSTGAERKDLNEILAGVDQNLPIILLDHQPIDLDAAKKAGVDLQVSGHTHRGQIFPANLITSRIFEEDWGYLKKGSLQLIVSCGYGTWGPPMRIGNRPEVLEILIHFKN